MDRISSLMFHSNYSNALNVLNKHGYPTGGLKPPFLLDYLGKSARSATPEEAAKAALASGTNQKSVDTPEGVKVELSRDAVQISVGPELVKNLKAADLGKMFEALYNTPQVKSVLERIGAS